MGNFDQEQQDIQRLAVAQLDACGFLEDAITVEYSDELQEYVVLLEGTADSISQEQLACLAEVAVRTDLDFRFLDRSLRRSFQIKWEEAVKGAYPSDRGRGRWFVGNSQYPNEEGDN